MFSYMSELQGINDILMTHGRDLLHGLLVIILGLLFVRWTMRKAQLLKIRYFPGNKTFSSFLSILCVLLVLVVITVAAVGAGLPIQPVYRLLVLTVLIIVGGILIFRPMVPELPFKIGNTIKAGDLLGKVQAISFLNTRLQTFDGKTVFVPNRKILDDIVINYHYTKERRIKINLGIHYDSDLIRAKQVLEELMIEDPRVLATPRPVVFVMSLTPDGVKVGARCWVPNLQFWLTKCDLIERIKLSFDREGIVIAHEQMDVFLRGDDESPAEELQEEAT